MPNVKNSDNHQRILELLPTIHAEERVKVFISAQKVNNPVRRKTTLASKSLAKRSSRSEKARACALKNDKASTP
jgi:hypothetical protein